MSNRASSCFQNLLAISIFPSIAMALSITSLLSRTTSTMSAPSTSSGSKLSLKHIPNSKLYKSEPNPAWFGNPPNEAKTNPHWSKISKNWLQSRFHFSFAEYSNYKNSNYGVLRVMNDDYVQPNRGFGTHGHANMEIVTYVVEGSLTHEDSMGTEESLGRGSVQFMTAGRGVRHSEFNLEKERGLRFIQTWIVPRKNGLKPNYGSFDPSISKPSSSSCMARNQWRHLVSDLRDTNTSTPVQIEQDANLFVAEMDANQSLTLQLSNDRMGYVLCVEGSVTLISNDNQNEISLNRHDGCEIIPISSNIQGGEVTFKATGSEKVEGGMTLSAHVMVFEMEYVEGAGRRDF